MANVKKYLPLDTVTLGCTSTCDDLFRFDALNCKRKWRAEMDPVLFDFLSRYINISFGRSKVTPTSHKICNEDSQKKWKHHRQRTNLIPRDTFVQLVQPNAELRPIWAMGLHLSAYLKENKFSMQNKTILMIEFKD